MRRKIGRWMTILGMVIFLIPLIGTIHHHYTTQRLYKEYLENLEQLEASFATLEPIEQKGLSEYTTQVTSKTLEVGNKKQDLLLEEGEVIGRIKIPSAAIDLLLVEGTSKKALKMGAGHMTGTALPGEIGNCAIAAHRNYTFGQMFNRLDEVAIEDEVCLEIGQESYTYKVRDITIVEPDDLSVINPSQDKKQITLITCHPIYKATHRLIVTGDLSEGGSK